MSDGRYDEFVYYWTEAVTKKASSGYMVGDVNQDAFTTAHEAYDYARTHDKKNDSGEVNFTLLSDVGEIIINQTATKDNIEIALDLYRDLFHL